MGKSGAQRQTEQNQLSLQSQQMQQAQANYQEQQRRQGLDEQYRQQLTGLAQPYLDAGTNALAGHPLQGIFDALFNPAKSAIAGSYDQGRQNLVESLGGQGLYGSGLGAGPLANLESSQAKDIGGASQQASLQALMQSLNLGQTGLGILSGQQAGLNPLNYGQLSGSNSNSVLGIDPNRYKRAGSGLLGSILGGATSAGLGALTGGTSLEMPSLSQYMKTPLAPNNQWQNDPWGGKLFGGN